MSIRQIYTYSDLRNFSYLLISDEKAICIDPFSGEMIDEILEKEKLTLFSIINTHEHWDHIQGNEYLQKKYNCPVYAHEGAAKSISTCTNKLKEGDLLEFGELTLEMFDTPGHTMAHICILVRQKDKVLGIITGDTLFNAGVGNCHHGGDPSVLYETISQKFGGLDDETPVYPGHDYLENNLKFTLHLTPENKEAATMLKSFTASNKEFFDDVTTIKKEKQINTFMRLENEVLRKNLKLENADDKTVFLKLRELRNSW